MLIDPTNHCQGPVKRSSTILAAVLSLAILVTPKALGSEQNPKTGSDFEARLERLAERLEEARIKNKIPGIAVSVVRGDDIVFAQGFGMRNVEKKLPVEPETLFAVGSTSKAFTSALVCLLQNDGKMALDDPVRKHVKKFVLQDEEANEKACVRDLLCHRTGLTRMGLIWSGGKLTDEEILGYVSKAQSEAPFRARFLYNNVMYLIAGMAAGSAGDSDWHRLIENRLFEPLGMESSNTSVAETEKLPTASKGYSWNEVEGVWDLQDMRDLTTIAPAGAINSNVLDMAQWVRFQLNRGRIGDETLLPQTYFEDEMWKTHTPIGPNVSYGLGWMLQEWEGKQVVEHGGNIDGFAAQVGLLPEENLGFCLLTNVSATPLQQGSISLVFDTLLGDEAPVAADEKKSDEPATFDEAELARYVGKFHFERMQADMTVLTQDGRLCVDVPGQTTYVLNWPNEDGRWVFELTDTIEVSFELPEGDGNATSMSLYQAGMTFTMPRAKVATDLPSVDDVLALRKKAGLYDPTSPTRAKGTARFVHQGVEGAFEVLTSEEKFRRTLDLGKIGKIETTYDGNIAYEKSPGKSAKKLTGKELIFATHEHTAATFGDWKSYWETVEVIAKRESNDGRKVFVVELTDTIGEKNELEVDAENGRILRRKFAVHQGGISFPMETRFRYDEDTDSVLSTRSVTAIPQSGQLILTLESFETGLEPLNDSLFVLETDSSL